MAWFVLKIKCNGVVFKNQKCNGVVYVNPIIKRRDFCTQDVWRPFYSSLVLILSSLLEGSSLRRYLPDRGISDAENKT